MAILPSASHVRNSARELRSAQALLSEQAAAYDDLHRAIAPGVWQGHTALGIRAFEAMLRDRSKTARDAMGHAASALDDLAAYLEQVKPAHDALVKRALQEKADHGNIVVAQLTVNSATNRLAALDKKIVGRLTVAANKVRAAGAESDHYDSDIRYNKGAYVREFIKGFGHESKQFGVGVFNGVVDPIVGLYEAVRHPDRTAAGIAAFAKDPGGNISKAWDGYWAEVRADPSKALGEATPGLILTIVTIGGSTALQAGAKSSTLAKAATSVAELEAKAPKSAYVYRGNFSRALPDLDMSGVVVHHAVEWSVLKKYPGLYTADELNAASNLRGIPKDINGQLHLRAIRTYWNAFYEHFDGYDVVPTKADLDDYSKYIDDELGQHFEENR